jgi:nitrous oxide reductase accessory protein NosL
MSRFLAALLLVTLLAVGAAGAEPKGRKPAPKDKCPVCGMFVAKFPDFAGQVVFKDGTSLFFDGAKDLFKFTFDLPRYLPGKKSADIAAVFITDYYTLTLVDGFTAFYVVGSDVYGPMGHELVPFAKEADAREFLKDHKGQKILRFKEVTPQIVKGLD